MHIDNMEVVNRTKLGIDAHLATDKCIKTDFDVWRETDHVVGLLKSTVSAAWVKGHQDDLLKKTGNIGPMPRDAHYNIAMDKRAERRRCESVATPSTLPMTTDKASLSINGCYITAKYKSSIKRAYTAPAICTYIKEKTGWTTAVFESVDWPSIGVYMKRLSIAKRAKVVKLMHNWQNTGRQKGLFYESSARSPADLANVSLVDRCPMGCGCYESSMHYLQCSKNPCSAEMKRGLDGIKQWMKKSDTNPALVSIMMRVLRKFTQNKEIELDSWNFENERDAEDLQRLVDAQKKIGWMNLFKGRLSLIWRELQLKHMSRTENPDSPRPEYQTADYWASNVIQQIVYYSLNAWQIRNDKLHEDKVEKAYMAKRRSLKSEVRGWYMIATTLGKEFDNLMKTTCIERQTHSNQMMESWLATMKEKHDYHVRKEFEDAQKKAERERQREKEKERRRQSRPNRGTRRSGGGRGRGGGRGSR